MDSAEVGVLEETDEVGLSSFLDSKKCLGLEPDFIIDTLGDGTDKSLEGSSGHEEVSLLLVSLDLSEGNCSWSESSLLAIRLDTSLGGGSLLASLGASGLGLGTFLVGFGVEFLSGNLVSCHCEIEFVVVSVF